MGQHCDLPDPLINREIGGLEMPKISVIIPVYKAGNVLRRCVESIVFGEEKDLEVILIEDCSNDGSWALCQKLQEEYPQVVCLQNDRNRGVSYTRNRGLDAATGRYVLFVDSDDWVCGSYAKTLITALENNPGKLVVCGYTLIDHTQNTRRDYGIFDASVLPRQMFCRLSEGVMLQQLWNKAFCLEDIRKAGIRFDETVCIGEDYQFVMDTIEAMDCQECVIIQQPLYYYIRYGNGSLMDQWFEREPYEESLNRALRLSRLCGQGTAEPEGFREGYVYRVLFETSLPEKKKRMIAGQILGKENARKFIFRQRTIILRQKVLSWLRSLSGRKARWAGRLRSITNTIRVRKGNKRLQNRDVTLLSQNGIGAVFACDMGRNLRSPVLNLQYSAAGFLKLVSHLEHYLSAELRFRWDEEYPIGILDDIEVHFVGFDTCQQASQAWNDWKMSVDVDKLFVLSTDRDGFDGAMFEQWKRLPYPKLLLTACAAYADHPDTLYFPEYGDLGRVPDLIAGRKFYKKNVLIRKINEMK